MSQSRQFHFPIQIGGRYHKRPMLLDWNITGIEKLAIGIQVRQRHLHTRQTRSKRLAEWYREDRCIIWSANCAVARFNKELP